MRIESYYGLFLTVVIMVTIIFLAYITTIFVGKKTNFLMGQRGMKILKQVNMGMNFQVVVLQVHQKVHILIKSNKNVDKIDTITLEEWNKNEELWSLEEIKRRSENRPGGMFSLEGLKKQWEKKKGDQD